MQRYLTSCLLGTRFRISYNRVSTIRWSRKRTPEPGCDIWALGFRTRDELSEQTNLSLYIFQPLLDEQQPRTESKELERASVRPSNQGFSYLQRSLGAVGACVRST